MPALSQPAPEESPLVLVSGASGYIAAHLCARLLINGYRVRGTVRSKEKGDWLKHLFSGVGAFEYVIVEDMTRVSPVDRELCASVADEVIIPDWRIRRGCEGCGGYW